MGRGKGHSLFGKPGLVTQWSSELDAEGRAGWLVLDKKHDATVIVSQVTPPLPTAAV